MKFHPKGLSLHCKDQLKLLNNFFYRILVTCSLFKLFNFVSYANITGVTAHHIMSSQKSIVSLTNMHIKNFKIALVYVLISQLGPVVQKLVNFNPGLALTLG